MSHVRIKLLEFVMQKYNVCMLPRMFVRLMRQPWDASGRWPEEAWGTSPRTMTTRICGRITVLGEGSSMFPLSLLSHPLL